MRSTSATSSSDGVVTGKCISNTRAGSARTPFRMSLGSRLPSRVTPARLRRRKVATSTARHLLPTRQALDIISAAATVEVIKAGNAHVTEATARIEVLNGCRWMGDPWLGRLHVYVDGAKVGIAPVFRCLESRISPGSHTVHIRLWWMKSAPVKVDLRPGSSVLFEGEAPQQRSLPRSLLQAAIRPAKCLALQERPLALPPE